MRSIIPKPITFEWDDNNSIKNWEKHGVLRAEAEQAFFNNPFFVFNVGKENKSNESRYLLLGKTDANRYLTVIFTIKENKVRIISVRDQAKFETTRYLGNR